MTAFEIVDNLDEGHPSRQMITTAPTPLPETRSENGHSFVFPV